MSKKFGTYKKYMYNYTFIWCPHEMTIDEHLEISTCNLAETMHIKWLQYSRNEKACLYEATLDALICAFMHIANYKFGLKRGNN